MKQCLRSPAVFVLAVLFALPAFGVPAPEADPAGRQTISQVLASARDSDWRALNPENTLYLDLDSGRVIIELCPFMAPGHTANVKALVRERFFDGLAVMRVQENYVTQWGDPAGDDPQLSRRAITGKKALPPEFDRPIDPGLNFTLLPDGDVYAPEVGFIDGFPVARDTETDRMWLVHSYGMIGAGRGNTADSGSGAEMYVVIGQAPRHLDRNITLFARVIQGMELLTSLPRGSGSMGFYEKKEQLVPIRSIRLAAELPEAERIRLEILRTDTPLFKRYIEARRNRVEEWFLYPVGRIELANIPIPVRRMPLQGEAD